MKTCTIFYKDGRSELHDLQVERVSYYDRHEGG